MALQSTVKSVLSMAGRPQMGAAVTAVSLQSQSRHSHEWKTPYLDPKKFIGKREVVGWGHNGFNVYLESQDYPLPAIRWREPTPEIEALREKEKGDWHNLTIEEKKTLYRYSFRQTFAEMDAPTGDWKLVIGVFGLAATGGLLTFYYLKAFVLPPPSLYGYNDPEAIRFRTRRHIDIRNNPITGIASKWDYENNKWK